MKRLVTWTTVIVGALLVVVPRYVLPACEYEGLPRMHCSDTAHAEMLVGALLVAAGALSIDAERLALSAASAVAACALLAVAWFMPDVHGYCASPRMPCHYGMVPAVRFVVVLGGAVLVPGAIRLGRAARAASAQPGGAPEAS